MKTIVIPEFTQHSFSRTDKDAGAYRMIAESSFIALATECVDMGYNLRFCGPYGNHGQPNQYQVDYEKAFADKFVLFNMKWSALFPDQFLMSVVLVGKYSSTVLMEHRIGKDEVMAHTLAYADYVRELEAFLVRVKHFGRFDDKIHTSYHRQVKLLGIE